MCIRPIGHHGVVATRCSAWYGNDRCQKVTPKDFYAFQWSEPQFHRLIVGIQRPSLGENRVRRCGTKRGREYERRSRTGACTDESWRIRPRCRVQLRESVLRELSSSRASGADRVPGRSITADETPLAPSLTPQRPGAPSLAPPCINYLLLDAGLDFIVHDDGMIELTEAGFRRMGQAHSAGLDTVIEVDRRRVLHFPGPRLGCSPSAPTS